MPYMAEVALQTLVNVGFMLHEMSLSHKGDMLVDNIFDFFKIMIRFLFTSRLSWQDDNMYECKVVTSRCQVTLITSRHVRAGICLLPPFCMVRGQILYLRYLDKHGRWNLHVVRAEAARMVGSPQTRRVLIGKTHGSDKYEVGGEKVRKPVIG